MTTPARTCPACGGAVLPRDPAGLRVQHLMACPLLGPEDQRHVADLDALAAGWFERPTTAAEAENLAERGVDPVPTTMTVELTEGWFERPTTAAETEILAALGADPVPTTTTVERWTRSIVRRTWRRAGLDGVPRVFDVDTGEWIIDERRTA